MSQVRQFFSTDSFTYMVKHETDNCSNITFLPWDLHLFNSSAAGDWVNCGICGEWAHFGCDRRQGLGAFKV